MYGVVFGEVLWDVYSDRRVIGGAPFNVAAHLSLLGEQVSLLSGVGRDALAPRTREALSHFGIDDRYVESNDHPTGEVQVTLQAGGIPQYHICEGAAYDYITLPEKALRALCAQPVDMLYFGTLAQRSAVSRAALHRLLDRVHARYILCDLNIRPGCYDRTSIRLCMERADILKVSEEEAHFLYDTDALASGGRGLFDDLRRACPQLSLIVYTRGAEGAAVYDIRQDRLYDPGRPAPVRVVSTVGAGDCYAATFLHAIARGTSIPAAMQLAQERSSIVVAHQAAIPEALREI